MLLDEASATSVYIVAAQCYGKFFADKLNELSVQSRQYGLNVRGISYENTWRVQGPDTSISTIVQHIELAKWIQDTFPLMESEIEFVDSSDDDDAPI